MPRFCSQIGGNIFEALRFGQWVAGVDWIGGLIGAGRGWAGPHIRVGSDWVFVPLIYSATQNDESMIPA